MAATDKEATNKDVVKRRERTPINGQRSILEVRGKEAGFHYAWVNDEYVDERQDNGFEHVRHPVQVGSKRLDVGKMPSNSFITCNVGGGKIAYLMRIPQEFYDEDMAREQRVVDERTQAQIGNLNKDGLSGSVKVSTGISSNKNPDIS